MVADAVRTRRRVSAATWTVRPGRCTVIDAQKADSTLTRINASIHFGGMGAAMRRLLTGATAVCVALSSCTTSTKEITENPKAVSNAALCRTFVSATDRNAINIYHAEIQKRGITYSQCAEMVKAQNAAATALVAVALVGTAVAVCANNNCGSGGYTPPPRYYGNCQYDWQYDAAGNRCGRRSAWSRPGGYY